MQLFLIICSCLYYKLLIASDTIFDWATGNTSVSLCALSYCDSNKLSNHLFSGYTESFNITKILHGEVYDSNGFIGYRTKDQTIYIVFRGSHSITNFLDDLNFITTSYPNCSSCLVHLGHKLSIIHNIFSYL